MYVSTGLWLCLEIDDCIRQQDSPGDSTSTVDTVLGAPPSPLNF